MTIIKQIDDVDFGIIDGQEGDRIRMKTVHGDVLIVKGLIEDASEDVMTMGIISGENTARIAFWKPMNEVKKMLKKKGI